MRACFIAEPIQTGYTFCFVSVLPLHYEGILYLIFGPRYESRTQSAPVTVESATVTPYLDLFKFMAHPKGVEPPCVQLTFLHVRSVRVYGCTLFWYSWSDLNRQTLRRHLLRMLCLPFHHKSIIDGSYQLIILLTKVTTCAS